MNWMKIVLAGLAGGIARNLVDFVMHEGIMGSTYQSLPDVFTQTPANPIWFFVNAIITGIVVAALFARSYKCWPRGWKGGLHFGFWFGLATFFYGFYFPLVVDGFPYFLAWCWGGIQLIGCLVLGVVIGAIYKP